MGSQPPQAHPSSSQAVRDEAQFFIPKGDNKAAIQSPRELLKCEGVARALEAKDPHEKEAQQNKA